MRLEPKAGPVGRRDASEFGGCDLFFANRSAAEEALSDFTSGTWEKEALKGMRYQSGICPRCSIPLNGIRWLQPPEHNAGSIRFARKKNLH